MTLPILYDARLVEQVVLQAARQLASESARQFHLERERAYEIADQQERETAFRAVFSRWFHALDLGRALSLALAEAPTLARQTRVCRVEEAARARDEGADLYDLARAALPDADLTPCDEGPAPPRIVFVRIRSQLFLDQAALLDLLRRELVHVTDMLDPSFGYERDLPPAEAGPSHDALLRARYRVLWNVTVDGRLQRRDLAAQGARDRRHREFCETFAMLGDRVRPEFERWWQMTCPTHACLLDFARHPLPRDRAGHLTGQCPVCRFPAPVLDPHPERLSEAARRAIEAAHPGWRLESGLCRQCADLYEARVGHAIPS